MRLLLVIFLLILGFPVFSKTITGEVQKDGLVDFNRVYDAYTNYPIPNAKVKIPSKNYITHTDEEGAFVLGTTINAPTIMSIEKAGYKPFSMTLNTNEKAPIIVGIEKSTPNDIVVETSIIHLGDNSFSENSANASEFTLGADGAFYSKNFEFKTLNNFQNVILSIGSIIGIDTLEAQKMGQSRVRTSYSSPPEIFCNGSKIAEIKINADNQKIDIPSALLFGKNILNITIKTGRNLTKRSDIDYDDIEFTNLLLEIK